MRGATRCTGAPIARATANPPRPRSPSYASPCSEFAQVDAVLFRRLVQPQLADRADRARRDLELDRAVELGRVKLLRLQVGVLPVSVVLVGEVTETL